MLAKKALKINPDYIAFGSFYKSKLKPKAKKQILALSDGQKKIKKPIVAIGGVNNKNYKKLIRMEQNILQYPVLFGITQS